MSRFLRWLRYTVIAGNVVYFLWILRNGIDEGFRATPVQAVSIAGLLVLLAVNTFLLSRRER